MMIINWGIESYKWKILIDKKQYFTLPESFIAILAGISIGIFTPNRIGEIGGRAVFLAKGKRTYGIFVTSIGSFAQFIATIICGLIGSILFLIFFKKQIPLTAIPINVSLSLLVLLIIGLLWAYFNVKKIFPFFARFRFLEKRQEQLSYLSEIRANELIHILILSIFRYFVFITQFYLLLLFFNVQLTFLEALASISLIYLINTIIPTNTIAELGIRGSLAIFFIGIFSDNITGILFSTILLWIINLAIPSMIGSMLFLKRNIV
jgi:uncharacterized membrane protein YbhN (UPF0104 family)